MQGEERGIHAWYMRTLTDLSGVEEYLYCLSTYASTAAVPQILAWCAAEALVVTTDQSISLANGNMHVAAERLA